MTSLWRFLLRVVWVMCLFNCSNADWLRDLQSGRTIAVGDGVKVRVDNVSGINQTSYFSSHVLRVFLGDVGLSLAKAKGKEGLQIGLFTSNADGSTEARGDANVFSVVLPLLIGFKIAGSILTTLVVVLVVSLKAFLASKVSLLLTGAGALKKMMMGYDHPPELHYPVEYFGGHPPSGYDYPSASGYNAAPHSAPSHSAPSSPGPSAHEQGLSASDSNVSTQYVTANATTAATQYQGVQGVRRRIYKRRNQGVPVLTVSKITRKGAVD